MSFKKLALSIGTAGYLMVCGTSAQALDVAQQPLFLGTDVPGNLVFVPSVEWPTIVSVANLQNNYTPSTEFVGYFDSNKCYEYRFSSNESDRHFYPIEAGSGTGGRECSGLWSGNFLNWAATQTIDPFRKVLTGGLRVRDTSTETWLEKARHTGQGGTGIYPNRTINSDSILHGATPFNTASSMRMRIQGLDNRMRFRLNGTNVGSGTPFDPDDFDDDVDDLDDDAYDVAIRVAVCVAGLEEDNCVDYNASGKPEGLIQANFKQLRYSAFGYLNDSRTQRDGAALRARQKFVGPTLPDDSSNPGAEWNSSTGVLFQNPDADDAADTSAEFGITIQNSGVINYINKFGQMTSQNHKSFDPVSELFYAAVRYIRGEKNVNAYTNGTTFNRADGFPVITDWDKDGHDPVQFSCQINVALGIGDIYTHRDKNLPGPTSGSEEPTKPGRVSSDDWIDVVDVGQRIDAMEGSTNIGSSGNSWTGRKNSGYIASLAYWANTTDMRPDEPGKTTMSTFWVDVLEGQELETIPYNQYILATKYGGADVPETFDPMNDALEQEWWHTNGETISPFGGSRGVTMPRPDNYFLAGNARDMIEAMSDAFETILSETTNVVTSVATTSTRLDTDTLAIQARFESEFWSGELLGLDPISNNVEWRATDKLPSAAGRKIISWNSDGLGTQVDFKTSMPGTMKTRIASSTDGQPIDDVINFLRGDRSNEASGFRRRSDDTVLGDIVNSRPVLAGPSNEGWARLSGTPGDEYPAYVDGDKSTRQPVVYVGGNDGMLHGFDASTGPSGGTEVMAYVPGAVLDDIGSLANPTYRHRFFVDGQIAIGDAYNSGWKNVLVGGLGAGGKAIYAIDVTNPNSPQVLWEITNDDYPEIGYTFGKPVINRIGNKWYAIFGNGYGSDDGQAHMIFVELFSGSSPTVHTVALGSVGGNGLSGVAGLSDPETGTELIRAYAGDLNGTIWRVDLDSGLPSGPATGFSAGLFTDPDGKAITATPALAASPSGGLIVYVGTGKLIETVDRTVSTGPAETFWAVIDKNIAISGTGGFNEVSMVGDPRVIEGEAGDDGWFLKLGGSNSGERVLNQARVIFGQLIFSSFEPDDDACATGGLQRVYVLDAISGTGRLDNLCNNCGVIELGTGAPVEPPVVLKPPVNPTLTPGDPGGIDPDDPGSPGLPGGSSVGAVTGWCSAFGVLSPSGFLPLGNICDGRQVWRQVR